MSLADATFPDGPAPPLPPGPPYACRQLRAWRGRPFDLPPGDPRLRAVHDGGPAPCAPWEGLVGMARWWAEHPDWMDVLDPASPVHDDKMVERALYLHAWANHLPPGQRVLDLGGGVGRFTQWFLARRCAVELVDPDLRSLRRAVGHAARQAQGHLDVHWSTGERLPSLAPVDIALAIEVLCYAEDPAAVLERVHATLRPGGLLLCSVEARWGWAMAHDAAPGSIDDFFGNGVVHVPGDRWVRTYTEDELRALLSPRFEVLEVLPSHYAFSGPFEPAAGPLDAARAIALEARLRAHPVARPLNRAWMAVARPRC